MAQRTHLVIDYGSHTIKAGFGDEGKPEFVISTVVGKVRKYDI